MRKSTVACSPDDLILGDRFDPTAAHPLRPGSRGHRACLVLIELPLSDEVVLPLRLLGACRSAARGAREEGFRREEGEQADASSKRRI